MRFGAFGGTFNPIHYGHLRAAEEAAGILGLEKVLFIPSGTPPLKHKDMAGADHRLNMARLAASSNARFEVSDIECRGAEKSYTVNTAQILRRIEPGSEPVFLLGSDAFLDIPHWHEPELLLTLMDFAVMNRPGSGLEDVFSSPYVDGPFPLPALGGLTEGRLRGGKRLILLGTRALDISATEIRKHARENESIKYLLPEDVEFYIISNRLYTDRLKGETG